MNTVLKIRWDLIVSFYHARITIQTVLCQEKEGKTLTSSIGVFERQTYFIIAITNKQYKIQINKIIFCSYERGEIFSTPISICLSKLGNECVFGV